MSSGGSEDYKSVSAPWCTETIEVDGLTALRMVSVVLKRAGCPLHQVVDHLISGIYTIEPHVTNIDPTIRVKTYPEQAFFEVIGAVLAMLCIDEGALIDIAHHVQEISNGRIGGATVLEYLIHGYEHWRTIPRRHGTCTGVAMGYCSRRNCGILRIAREINIEAIARMLRATMRR